jgi:hypothetical protein
MNCLIKENIVKNILIALCMVPVYPLTREYIYSFTRLPLDLPLAGDTLIAISILSVMACFGNFAFSYRYVNMNDSVQRYIAHITTFMLMWLMGISLIFTSLLMQLLVGYFVVIDIALLILYLAIVCYDFSDLLNAIK